MKTQYLGIIKFGESEQTKWTFEYDADTKMWAAYGVGGQKCWTGLADNVIEARTYAKTLAKNYLVLARLYDLNAQTG